MSYVAGGKTFDEGGYEIDGMGQRLSQTRDPDYLKNQPFSATAANMGKGSSASGGATVEDARAGQSGSNPWAAASGGNTGDPRLNGLYDELTTRSRQSLNVDANDPGIKSQIDAASVAGQRSLLNNEKEAAARGGAYATGAVDANARMGREALGENLQGLTATAIGNEITARRAEIQSALEGRLGVLSLDEQVKLKQQDQALAARQTDLSAQQQSWMQAFQEKGFTADQAARLWQEMFNQRGQDMDQSNTVWNQNWKLSGGA